jgi:hypothetical protein
MYAEKTHCEGMRDWKTFSPTIAHPSANGEQIRKPPRTARCFPVQTDLWVTLLVLSVGCATAVTAAYTLRQQERANQLSADNQRMSVALTEMRSRVDALSSRLNEINSQRASAERETPSLTPSQALTGERVPPRGTTNSRQRIQPVHWKQLQTQLDNTQKQIAVTREDLERSRSDLQNSLRVSHYELSGSIARNHEELVDLQKRGQRSYFEFDLARSKQFQRTGPLALSLRKIDNKRARYNMEILVGDNRISKKGLSLYEPVVFYPEDSHLSVELVVNHIDEQSVHGYVSAAKYSQSETASTIAPAFRVRPSMPSQQGQAQIQPKPLAASKSGVTSSVSGDQYLSRRSGPQL